MASRRPVWFNRATGRYTEIATGDVVDSTLLENVIVGGSVGDTTHVPVLTYDAHGRLTAVSSAVISAGSSRAYAFFTT